ncbi:MAG: VWA domain-containing protein [Myxococcota bacterium]
MGYGEYSHAAHVALTRSRARSSPARGPSRAHPLLQPHGVVRESRDSDEHPDSLGVVFALDVTGSMGSVPHTLATRTLPDFMRVLLDAGVRDPQLCFMGIGHAGHDRAPLQVGQFESSEALIDLWLDRIWIEGGGVGDHEAYELAMYFAAHKIVLDSVERRGRRGFLFLVGDVAPNPAASHTQIRRLLGDELSGDVPIRALIESLQRTFEPFFLMAPSAPRRIARAWRDLLGDRVVSLQHADDTAHVAAGLIALLEGSVSSIGGYVDRLEAAGLRRRQRARIAQALLPFAASIERDGAPIGDRRGTDLPRGDRPSGLDRG